MWIDDNLLFSLLQKARIILQLVCDTVGVWTAEYDADAEHAESTSEHSH